MLVSVSSSDGGIRTLVDLKGKRPAQTTYIDKRHNEKIRLFTPLGCHLKVEFLYIFVSTANLKDEGLLVLPLCLPSWAGAPRSYCSVFKGSFLCSTSGNRCSSASPLDFDNSVDGSQWVGGRVPLIKFSRLGKLRPSEAPACWRWRTKGGCVQEAAPLHPCGKGMGRPGIGCNFFKAGIFKSALLKCRFIS